MKRIVCFFAFFVAFACYCQGNPYTAKKGDTAKKIAKAHNITLDDFYKWNRLSADEYIIAGKEYIVESPRITEESQGSQEQEEKSNEEKVVEMPDGLAQKQEFASVRTNVIKPTETGSDNGGGVGSYGNKNQPSSISWVWLLLGFLAGFGCGVFLFYLLYVKKLMTDYRYKENELRQVKFDLDNEKTNTGYELSKLRLENRTLKQRNKDLDGENNSLREEIAQLKTTQYSVNEDRIERTAPISTTQASTQASEQATMLFADAIIDDYFVKVRDTSNEDSIFVLHLSGENSAKFTIHKPAYQRILVNPSFLEGCDKQILRDTMQLEIVSEGRAQRDASNGKWKIIEKLNVIIK